MKNQIIFWILWFIISSWTIKTFYFSYQKKKLEGLRLAILSIDLSVLILFFLPWLPYSLGGKTAFQLIQEKNWSVVLFFLMLIISAVLFSTKKAKLFLFATCLHVASSIFIIVIMIWLTRGTYLITIREVAPVVAALLLLIGNVTALLLLHQLQLKEKKIIEK